MAGEISALPDIPEPDEDINIIWDEPDESAAEQPSGDGEDGEENTE